MVFTYSQRGCTFPRSKPIDVLIVGSGPAASVSAYRISQRYPDWNIVVFEKGPYSDPNEYKPKGRNIYDALTVEAWGRTIRYHQVQGLGGNTLHYGGLWIHPTREVFPLYRVYLRYFKKAEKSKMKIVYPSNQYPNYFQKLCGLYGEEDYNSGNGFSTSSFCSLPRFAKSRSNNGRPTISNTYLTNDISNISICYDSYVNKVLFKPNNNEIYGVELINGTRYKAKHIIIGGGFYHTPMLLLRSEITEKIPNFPKTLGKNWKDEYALLIKWKLPNTTLSKQLIQFSTSSKMPNQLHIIQDGEGKRANFQ